MDNAGTGIYINLLQLKNVQQQQTVVNGYNSRFSDNWMQWNGWHSLNHSNALFCKTITGLHGWYDKGKFVSWSSSSYNQLAKMLK
jgi:hypothetical protein